MRDHPGVVELVSDMRARGELLEDDDIEYAGVGGMARARGASGSVIKGKQRARKGLAVRMLASLFKIQLFVLILILILPLWKIPGHL